MSSLYDALEINQQATDAEIKKAYRGLSLRHHPDRPGGNSEKFRQISEAYEILGDAQKKAEYDRFGGGEVGGGGFGHEDFFAHVFGGQGGPNIRIHRMNGHGPGPEMFHGFPSHLFQHFMAPPSIQLQIVISLQQAFTGCTIPMQYEKFIVQNNQKTIHHLDLTLDIPEGISDNETIVLEKKGNEINGMIGDVRIIVHIHNTTEFNREGLNLIYPKTITLKEALCGFSFDIPLLTGISLTIKNNNSVKVIKPGHQQCCQGYGMKRNGQTGNLLVEFKIDFPESLTAAQKEVLNTLL